MWECESVGATALQSRAHTTQVRRRGVAPLLLALSSAFVLGDARTRQSDRHRSVIEIETGRQTDRQTDRQPTRQTDRQTDSQTDRQRDRNRQIDRQTDRPT